MAPTIDTSSYSALGGVPNLSAAAAAAANPSLLGLGPASAAALQLRLATAAGAVQQGVMDGVPGDKSETRRQRRYLLHFDTGAASRALACPPSVDSAT